MPGEIIYQRYIVQSVNLSGGYAVKLSNKVMSGIPDLLIKCLEWTNPQIWEVKRSEPSWVEQKALPRPISIGVTELQRKTLRDMRKAGIQVAILMVLPGPGRSVTLVLTRDLTQTHIQPEEFMQCHHVKTLNTTWNDAILGLNQKCPP